MIYKYQKVKDQYTDYIVSGENITELATIDGWTYVATDDELPQQVEQVAKTLALITPTPALKAQIAAASPIVQRIRDRAAEQIRDAVSLNDELKLIRDEITAIQKAIGAKASPEYAEADAKVKAVRHWSAAEKAKLGL